MSARIEQLRKMMAEKELDAIWITGTALIIPTVSL